MVIQPCFGVNSPIHKTRLKPLYSDAAYSLRTDANGVALTDEVKTKPKKQEACAFALAISSHPQYQFVTVYMKRAQLNIRGGGTGKATLVFMGNSQPGVHLSSVVFDSRSSARQSTYVNSYSWPKNSTLVYILLMHDFIGNRSGLATFHLEISLTPTFLCVLTQFQAQGSYTNLLNPYELSWRSISEMFHPGWLVCTLPWAASEVGLRSPHRFVAYCVDYRLSCDHVVNCPRNSRTAIRDGLSSVFTTSADESSRGLVCYSPSVNWLLVAIVLFSIINTGLLFAITYLGLLRRYSPIRFLRLQSVCIRYGCCCLPATWRTQFGGGVPIFRRNSISSSDSVIPWSPPTYESVERADTANLVGARQTRQFRWRRQKPVAFAESGHHLPPSYTDENEEISVLPEGIIQKMRSLRKSPSRLSERVCKPPRLKPLSQRARQTVHRTTLRQELRFVLRQAVSRTRALINSGFRVMRVHPANPSTTTPEQNEAGVLSDGVEGSSVPHLALPNYSEFMSGDFPRYPAVVQLDDLGPPPSSPTGISPRPNRRRNRRRTRCMRF
uniref:Cadherin domain-containing protein n=1 Tax=Mesocestoides corti TaxID=53468 RepID=A0A5K3EQK4_MESCO